MSEIRRTKNYFLGLLTFVLAFNYVDRFALGVVLQDIKIDLSLSDTQLGLLTGIAFALFYALMGIPIARWADRGNRVTIISLTIALWSAGVVMCGMAANFMQLMLMRVWVAVGEAGCYSPSLSLIADYFDRQDRPKAVSRFMLGIPLAKVIGFFAAGWLNAFYGWRVTFIVLGVPGLVLAVLARWTLKEPRNARLNEVADPTFRLPLKEVFKTLWANKSYRHLLYSFSVWGFFGYGVLQWQPAFFMRSHGLATGELGTWFASVYVVAGFLGTWLGGELASRYAVKNEQLQLKAIAIVYAALASLSVVVYLVPNYKLAFAAIGLSTLGTMAANGPLFAATQTLVPPRMRAMSIAAMYFFCNLIGMGLGPLAVGALSDALRPTFGEDSLRYALLAFSPGFFWCTWHFWQASRTALHDAAAVQSAELAPANL